MFCDFGVSHNIPVRRLRAYPFRAGPGHGGLSCYNPAEDLVGKDVLGYIRELVQCAAGLLGYRALSEAASSAAHTQVTAQDHMVQRAGRDQAFCITLLASS